jgi:thioredoxin 2
MVILQHRLESSMSGKLKVVCPSCHTANSIPADRLGDGPHCGKCKNGIFNAHPVELNQNSFHKHVDDNDIPLLVDFWAPWCGPCRAMAPAFEQATGELEPNVRLAKLNTDEEQVIGAGLGIRSIPTMILFRNGREIARQSGALMSGDIVRWVRSQLG